MNALVANYGWWLLALVLIGAELLLPSYFLLSIGIAAAIVGTVLLLVPDLSALAQAGLFGVLALIAAWLVYWKLQRRTGEPRNNQPLLNKRGQRMIGRRVIVCEAIVNGRGKVAVGDGEWLAEGPDVPIGTEVEIVSLQGTTFTVKPTASA